LGYEGHVFLYLKPNLLNVLFVGADPMYPPPRADTQFDPYEVQLHRRQYYPLLCAEIFRKALLDLGIALFQLVGIRV
jgi:hypothetical protein